MWFTLSLFSLKTFAGRKARITLSTSFIFSFFISFWTPFAIMLCQRCMLGCQDWCQSPHGVVLRVCLHKMSRSVRVYLWRSSFMYRWWLDMSEVSEWVSEWVSEPGWVPMRLPETLAITRVATKQNKPLSILKFSLFSCLVKTNNATNIPRDKNWRRGSNLSRAGVKCKVRLAGLLV